jgi:hypothetical protein
VKGCELTIHGAVLLGHENKALRTANQKKEKKQKEKKQAITFAHKGILSIEEGQEYVNRIQGEQAQAQAHEQEQDQAHTLGHRAPPRCSVYRSLTHNVRKCPERGQ